MIIKKDGLKSILKSGILNSTNKILKSGSSGNIIGSIFNSNLKPLVSRRKKKVYRRSI